MVKVEISLHINRPVAEVFNYLNDPAKMPEWNSTMEEATPSESPLKVGTRIRTRIRMLGRKIEGTVEVVEQQAIRTEGRPTIPVEGDLHVPGGKWRDQACQRRRS